MRALIIALLVLCTAAPVSAQLRCSGWTAFRKQADERGDIAVGGGIVSQRAILQLFVSRDGARFTLVLIDQRGQACVVAAGSDWMQTAMPPLGEPS